MFKERSLNRRSTQLAPKKPFLPQGEEDDNSLRKFNSVEDLRKRALKESNLQNNKEQEVEKDNEKDHYSHYFKRYEIMIEFANLRNHNQCPNGVYVIPLPENINIWYGVLFIHKGYYKGAVLKFRIDIPISYPNSSPSVTFLTDVFHPLVDKNGQLNLEFKFPSWTPRYDHIIDILKFIKSCFKVAVLNNITEEATFNKQAYQLYNNEPHLFARLSQQCTRLSQSEQVAFENPEEDNPINFIPLTNNKFEELYPQFLGPTGSKIIHGTSNSLKQTSSLDNVISNIKKSVSTNINKLFD